MKRILIVILVLSILLSSVGCLPNEKTAGGIVYWGQIGSNVTGGAVDDLWVTNINGVPYASVNGTQWIDDANGIHYSPVGGGSVAINTPSVATELLTVYSNDGVSNNPVLKVHDNSASGLSRGIMVDQAGAKTDDIYGIYITNGATSGTAGANKYGLYVSSSSVWNGVGSTNYGLYIDTPVGGTTNVAAYIAGNTTITGDLDMATHQINNVVDPTLAQDAATKNYVDTHGVSVNITTSTSTNITGILKGDGSNIQVATMGVDYVVPGTLTTSYVPYTGATNQLDLGSQNLTTTGNMTASYYFGNGSNLTGITASTNITTATATDLTGTLLGNGATVNAYIPGWYGDGSDGDVTVSSNTTTSGPITSGALTRDAYFNNLTINTGCILQSASYRIFCTGTLLNNGIIQRNGLAGGNGGNASSGAVGSAGAASFGLSAGSLGASTAGGAGAVGVTGNSGGTAGNTATAGTNNTNSKGATGGTGNTGGATTNPNVAAGGASKAGGTRGVPAASETGFRSLPYAITLRLLSAVTLVNGGTGGGGGGSGAAASDQANGARSGGSGGGGSGGGLMVICAVTINNTSGVISSNGGAGGNAGTGWVDTTLGNSCAAGSSGGGGGGGGVVVIVYQSATWGTETANGGGGGSLSNAVTFGTGAGSDGVAGTAGSDGMVLKLRG